MGLFFLKPKIYKKLISFFSVIVFLFFPFGLTSETLDTKIAADSIIVDSDQILHATGKVTVQHGKVNWANA